MVAVGWAAQADEAALDRECDHAREAFTAVVGASWSAPSPATVANACWLTPSLRFNELFGPRQYAPRSAMSPVLARMWLAWLGFAALGEQLAARPLGLQELTTLWSEQAPLMHVVAAKAVAFKEALEPEFSAYQRQTLANARAMAAGLIARGYEVMAGGTDNHMLLVDLRGARIDAVGAERALHAAHIAVNRASLPGDTGSEPTQGGGGLRLGTPAVTTRGLREPELRTLTGWMADILDEGGSDTVVGRVRDAVVKMCASFPVYGAQ
jgi:hypothetical protein